MAVLVGLGTGSFSSLSLFLTQRPDGAILPDPQIHPSGSGSGKESIYSQERLSSCCGPVAMATESAAVVAQAQSLGTRVETGLREERVGFGLDYCLMKETAEFVTEEMRC